MKRALLPYLITAGQQGQTMRSPGPDGNDDAAAGP
jgi:hypothetical protein